MEDGGGRSHNGKNREALNQNGKKYHIQQESEGEVMHGYSVAGLAGGPDKCEDDE